MVVIWKQKKCIFCKEYKTHDLYHRQKSSKDGRHHRCKECRGKERIIKKSKDCIECLVNKPLYDFGRYGKGKNRVYFDECIECRDLEQKRLIDLKLKVCSVCKLEKSIEDFYKSNYNSTGLAARCIKCERDREKTPKWNTDKAKNTSMLYRYGITQEDYESMLADQNYGCFICGITEENLGKRLSVDHDRNCCPGDKSCGSCVRGLLCNDHNLMIGLARDNPQLLRVASEYVSLYQTR